MISTPHNRTAEIEEATRYFASGGLGEVIGFVDTYWNAGARQVVVNVEMAMALCILADKALKSRQGHAGGRA